MRGGVFPNIDLMLSSSFPFSRGAQSCVVAFSLTDRKSFEAVESWLFKVVEEIGEGK